jgi:hypothetical protein
MANYERIASRKARKYGLNPRIFRRQIRQESGFQPHVVSPAGARGIAQIMPATARSWGVNPDNPRQALDAAARTWPRTCAATAPTRTRCAPTTPGPGAIQASHGYAETNAYVRNILGGGSGRATGRERGGGGGCRPAHRRRCGNGAPWPARPIQLHPPDDVRQGRIRAGGTPVDGRPDAPTVRARQLVAVPDRPAVDGDPRSGGLQRLEAGLVDQAGLELQADPGAPGAPITGSGGAGILMAKGRGRVSIARTPTGRASPRTARSSVSCSRSAPCQGSR